MAEKVAHYIPRGDAVLGKEVSALCGREFILTELAPIKAICRPCLDAAAGWVNLGTWHLDPNGALVPQEVS